MDNQAKPLQAALHGMDGRTYKTMILYFQGPCKNAAIVVEDTDAEVDVIDIDFAAGKDALNNLKALGLPRPVIVFSREEIKEDGIINVEKPIRLATMLAAFDEAKAIIAARGLIKPLPEVAETGGEAAKNEAEASAGKRILDSEERRKVSKHRTALQLDEGAFVTFIGIIPGIDFNDSAQVLKAYYHPKDYFQGYVISALKVAKEKNKTLQLNSTWKPLLIFPHSHEVWLDADDKQLRAFASLEMNKATGAKLSISTIDISAAEVSGKLERFQEMNAFLWKLAIWTSKGRYPQTIDIQRPIFIKHWPNFTRFLITPHALRITALLIKGPRTLLNIAEVLNIKPQYVFVFVSAAHTLGLIGQAERKTDDMFAPPPVKTEPKQMHTQGLLSKILGKLRSSK